MTFISSILLMRLQDQKYYGPEKVKPEFELGHIWVHRPYG